MHNRVGESVMSDFALTCFVTLGLISSGGCPFNHSAFAITQATPCIAPHLRVIIMFTCKRWPLTLTMYVSPEVALQQ